MGIEYAVYTRKNYMNEDAVKRVAEILKASYTVNVSVSDIYVRFKDITYRRITAISDFLQFNDAKRFLGKSNEANLFSTEEAEVLKDFFKDIHFIIISNDCNDECHLYAEHNQQSESFSSFDIKDWEYTPEHTKTRILKALTNANISLDRLRKIF